jgi:hypothetical protein
MEYKTSLLNTLEQIALPGHSTWRYSIKMQNAQKQLYLMTTELIKTNKLKFWNINCAFHFTDNSDQH